MRDTPLSPSTPPLVISGLGLAFGDGGIPTSITRLVSGLGRVMQPGTLRFVVAEDTKMPALPASVDVETIARKLPRSRAVLTEIATGLALGQKMKARYPDAVFFTASDFWAFRAPKKRLAITYDALPEIDAISAGSAIRRTHRKLCMRYARRATRWVSISHSSSHELAKWVGHGRAPDAFPLWVDRAFELPVSTSAIAELRTRLRLPERFYLYVGGYRKYKNVELLIRAHAIAARQAPIPPLVLAGKVPEFNSATQPCDVHGEIARSQCAPGSILLLGYVADADLPVLYAAATLFVSASLHEGFGYPPVEAMAVGCPVLVADRTSFTEVVSRPACRFNPDDEAGLARLFIAAATDPSSFHCPFSPSYTERAGIERMTSLIQSLQA